MFPNFPPPATPRAASVLSLAVRESLIWEGGEGGLAPLRSPRALEGARRSAGRSGGARSRQSARSRGQPWHRVRGGAAAQLPGGGKRGDPRCGRGPGREAVRVDGTRQRWG